MMQKNPEKSLKPWQTGTHLRVLSEFYPMNNVMVGLRWVLEILSLCVLTKIALTLEELTLDDVHMEGSATFCTPHLINGFFCVV